MRVTIRLVAALLAAVALVGADVAAAERSRTAAPPTVIRLISVTTKSSDTDKSPKGPSKGDRSTASSRLVNAVAQFGKPSGATVGSDSGVFTVTSATTIHANGTARLPGGTLRFRGRTVIEDGVFVIPVVSGTGQFVGARGRLLVPVTPAGTKQVVNVYQLTYAAAA